MHEFTFGFWFFIPAGLANMAPIVVAHLPIVKNWSAPVDFGAKLRGKRLFGAHKTWRGLIAGVLVAVLVCWLQRVMYQHLAWAASLSQPLNYGRLDIFWLGVTLGLGALAGDMIKSFFKRQSGVAAGQKWFPFDQLDYIIGGLILSRLVVALSAVDYLSILIIYFVLHLIVSYLGYLLKLKDSPI